jgi:hypothetical protein
MRYFRSGLFEVPAAAVEWCTPHMLRRFQSFFWRALDQVMPDGPPVLLAWVILILLIVNAIIA